MASNSEDLPELRVRMFSKIKNQKPLIANQSSFQPAPYVERTDNASACERSRPFHVNHSMTKNVSATDASSVRQRVKDLLTALTDGLYEREEAVRLAFLTAAAGESIFLLGPPGVGKSLIARRLKHAFADGTSFEYLMSKFTTPDEIFGPISIKKLKENDQYERLTERYLPGPTSSSWTKSGKPAPPSKMRC